MFYASLSQRHRNQQLCGLELAKALQHPKAHQLIWASMALSWWTSRTPARQTAWHRAALGCGLRTAVGKNHRGKPFCCLAKQKKALEILSGGQVLAELAVAISGVVGMVSSPCDDSSGVRSQSWRELLGSFPRQQEQAASLSGAFLSALPFISPCPFLGRGGSALSFHAPSSLLATVQEARATAGRQEQL